MGHTPQQPIPVNVSLALDWVDGFHTLVDQLQEVVDAIGCRLERDVNESFLSRHRAHLNQ